MEAVCPAARPVRYGSTRMAAGMECIPCSVAGVQKAMTLVEYGKPYEEFSWPLTSFALEFCVHLTSFALEFCVWIIHCVIC